LNVEILDSAPDNAITVLCHRCGTMPASVNWKHASDKDQMVLTVSCHGEHGVAHLQMLEVIVSPNLVVFTPGVDESQIEH